MSTIRCIYHPNADGSRRDPGFPATDQHPSAIRYPFDHPTMGMLNIDALDGAPTLVEVDALFNPAPALAASNAVATEQRSRAQQIDDVERRLNSGAPQDEINQALLNLLKE